MAEDWRSKIHSIKDAAVAAQARRGGGGGSRSGGDGGGFHLGKLPFGRKLIGVGIGLLIVYIFFSATFFYVPPIMVGIKQVYFGSNAGIRNDVYGPGLWFIVPGMERMHLFPAELQVINFSDNSSEVSKEYRSFPAVKIQTSDGYNVKLDVSVLYRLTDAYRVLVEAGPGRTFEDRLVVPRADRILRKTLGELNSEQFYQGPQRIAKATSAEQQLAAEIKEFGIAVDAVLVRRYTYDERYQQIIEGRKIKDQTVFLRQAETKAAIEERKRDTMVAEGEATVGVELARGDAEVKKLESQADLYRRKKQAEGQLRIELAEAKGTQLENDALQGAGSENMVGLKMAEVLKGIDSLVLSTNGKDGVNPLDLAELLHKFEVK